jgi:DNA-binding MarR family transcriptional regulator
VADDLRIAAPLRELVLAVERYREVRARGVLGISSTELVALGSLYMDGPQTPTDLAKTVGITAASATELCDRLERAGLARREPHATDRRKRLIVLTPRARASLTAIYRELGDIVTPALNPAAADDITAFLLAAAAALAMAARNGPRGMPDQTSAHAEQPE